MTPAPNLGRVLRRVAAVLLAFGVAGAVGSVIGMTVTALVSREHLDTAARAFMLSGTVLCVAATVFGIARVLTTESRSGRDPEPEP